MGSLPRLYGYRRWLCSCNALHAEMWGMWIGIQMARQRGITIFSVESDSKVLVDMLTQNDNIDTIILEEHILGALSNNYWWYGRGTCSSEYYNLLLVLFSLSGVSPHYSPKKHTLILIKTHSIFKKFPIQPI